MDIQYLKIMKNNPLVGDEENEGITKQQITEMEAFANHKFPDAYREFLYMGGHNNNVTQFSDSSGYLFYQKLRKSVDLVLQEDDFKIERDFWVIAALDGGQQFDFFFYDEGENPPIYYYCSYLGEFDDNISGEGPGIKKISDFFTKYVEKRIKAHKA